jgi:hypothetical protein
MTRVSPGVDQVIVICSAPGCEWHREAAGKRACEQAVRQGQAHADRKGHAVELHHKHSVIADLNEQ